MFYIEYRTLAPEGFGVFNAGPFASRAMAEKALCSLAANPGLRGAEIMGDGTADELDLAAVIGRIAIKDHDEMRVAIEVYRDALIAAGLPKE
jgi:hypothetical protein